MREISVSMNSKVPVGFDSLSSSRSGCAALFDRPMIYAFPPWAYFAYCFKVPRPMPEVAPTNTATRLDTWPESLKAKLDLRISFMLTILSAC